MKKITKNPHPLVTQELLNFIQSEKKQILFPPTQTFVKKRHFDNPC